MRDSYQAANPEETPSEPPAPLKHSVTAQLPAHDLLDLALLAVLAVLTVLAVLAVLVPQTQTPKGLAASNFEVFEHRIHMDILKV
ncbi:MAG: hypothetical protein M1830_002630 [Pleopsidium flavum]|nr:MAG: hypothetical protein M1830_002630 [Pleopsidium flavum]